MQRKTKPDRLKQWCVCVCVLTVFYFHFPPFGAKSLTEPRAPILDCLASSGDLPVASLPLALRLQTCVLKLSIYVSVGDLWAGLFYKC